MSDGAADRADAVPPVPPVHGDEDRPGGAVPVPVRVAGDFESDLSDRRVIKAVLAAAATLLFGLAVMGWL